MHADTKWIGSITARVGYAFDRFLFFARGGAAWAHQTYDFSGPTGVPFAFSGSDTRTGWTVGAGFEWAFMAHWSTTVAYDYYDFGGRNVVLTGSLGTLPMNITQRIQTVTLGLNYHF